MRAKRFDLFQLDETNGERFPFYPKSEGYTKAEADKMVAHYRKSGCNLTKRAHKASV